MTIQAIGGTGLWLPNSAPFTGPLPSYVSAGITLSTAAGRQAFIFQVPKTGTLDWFEVMQLSNTNTPDNGIRFAFMDLTAGKPDNTEDQYSVVTAGFGTNAWLVPPSYMGSTGPGSGSKRSVTKGDWIACQLRFENFVASDSVIFGTMSISGKPESNYALNAYIGTSTNSGTAWTVTNVGTISIALKYSDGTYAQFEWPHICPTVMNTRAYNSASTPDERGFLFQLPFPARIKGCWIRTNSANAFDIVLYDAADTPLVTLAPTVANVYSATGANAFYLFSTSQAISKNSNYRLVVKPGASSITTYDMDFNSSAIRSANVPDSTWMSTSRTNAGAWTDTNTNFPFMGLVLDGFDDAGGGGGSYVF